MCVKLYSTEVAQGYLYIIRYNTNHANQANKVNFMDAI